MSLEQFYPDWNFVWFYRINSFWSSPWLDAFLPLVRNKLFWAPLYAFIAVFLLSNHGKKGLWAIVFCLAAFAVSNTLSAEVLKPVFKQDRPCNNEVVQAYMVLRANCGGGKSFPSAHATNHFALSIYLWIVLRRKYRHTGFLLVFWAAMVSYAQVYVGVHYPVDVLAGAALGVAIGWLTGVFYNRVVRFY